MNILTILLASVIPLTAPHNEVRGSTPVITNQLDVLAGLTNGVDKATWNKATWNRERSWALDYDLVTVTNATTVTRVFTNDIGMVMTDVGTTVRYEPRAMLWTRVLDVRSDGFFPVVSYTGVTAPATLSGNAVSAPTGGVYLVQCADQDGVRRDSVVLLPDSGTVFRRRTDYVADTGFRKMVNDWVYDEHVKYVNVYPTQTVTIAGRVVDVPCFEAPAYSARKIPFCSPTTAYAGNEQPYILGTRCLCTAAHYSNVPVGRDVYGLDGPDDSFVLINFTRGTPVRALDWARSHGFTEAELAAMPDLGDVLFIPTTGDEFPEWSLPYLLTPVRRDELLGGGSLKGLFAWTTSAHVPVYAIPALLDYDPGSAASWTFRFARRGDIPREDMFNALGSWQNPFFATGGDSGHPVFVLAGPSRRDSVPILVSQFHTTGGGPDLIAAYPVIKAYNDSIGSTIKEY